MLTFLICCGNSRTNGGFTSTTQVAVCIISLGDLGRDSVILPYCRGHTNDTQGRPRIYSYLFCGFHANPYGWLVIWRLVILPNYLVPILGPSNEEYSPGLQYHRPEEMTKTQLAMIFTTLETSCLQESLRLTSCLPRRLRASRSPPIQHAPEGHPHTCRSGGDPSSETANSLIK